MSNPDQLVRDFAAAWGRGDTEAILATFTDDAVYHNIPMAPLTGKDEIRAFLDSFINDGINFEIRSVIKGAPHAIGINRTLDNEKEPTEALRFHFPR